VEEACLWLPALVLLAVFSLGSRVSYGIRYLLPILPLACIYASRLVPWVLSRGRAVRGAGLALLLAYPASVLLATPDTISYFNLLAGGRGDHYLIDSNLDWGQGLERLRAYLDREHLPGIALAYFGHVDPALYGIRYRLPDPHRPGLAAVSVNFLHGYPYVTDIAGHMVPVPADTYAWIAHHPRRADLGGGLFLFEIGAGAPQARGEGTLTVARGLQEAALHEDVEQAPRVTLEAHDAEQEPHAGGLRSQLAGLDSGERRRRHPGLSRQLDLAPAQRFAQLPQTSPDTSLDLGRDHLSSPFPPGDAAHSDDWRYPCLSQHHGLQNIP
jgi:hypothetical protein